MLEISWEGMAAIVSGLTALGGLFIGGIKIGELKGKLFALTDSVNRQGIEIGDLRNRVENLAPASSLSAFDGRLQSLTDKIDTWFQHLSNRIDTINTDVKK